MAQRRKRACMPLAHLVDNKGLIQPSNINNMYLIASAAYIYAPSNNTSYRQFSAVVLLFKHREYLTYLNSRIYETRKMFL